MGMGRFKNGKFDLVVVANFAMNTTDFAQWRRSFEKASELFWDASEGQLQYGKIFVCDESVGLDTAEIILHATGTTSYGTTGEFGRPGAALHLMPYVKFEVLTHQHEMGHHVWALGEEYAREFVREQIDTSVAPANNATVPLVGSSFAAGALVGAGGLLVFASGLERQTITANSANSLTVSTAFSQSPLNDTDGLIAYQFPAECATSSTARFCIMERSRGAAGTLDAAGNWTPAANPVTEFCSHSNHDPDGDTQQQTRNGESCWEWIVSRPGYTALTAPDPAAAGPVSGFTVPEWIVLDKQPRFALMIDRSGSMSAGHKMADARHGAVYWVEFCAVGNDLLSVVSYDDQIDTLLNLTQVSTIGVVGPTGAIDALMPRGMTNIRDALFQARDQIESPATRAAVQVGLLLTDGIHNFPPGSSPSEAVPAYQEGGIRLYTLGVGQPAAVDMTTLDTLATETGGRSFAVGDDEAGLIENAMVEINAEVRGGIITTQPVLFPDSRPSRLDRLLAPRLEEGEGSMMPSRRPSMNEVLDAAGVKSLESLLAGSKDRSNRISAIPVVVEPGADRASFATVHPDAVDVWLYLVDPDGHVVDPTAVGVHHVESSAPHEFIVIDRPRTGRWLLVLLRVRAGEPFRAGVVAGGENRNLQVFASAPPLIAPGSAVAIEASARWGHELTNLTVFAEVATPSGGRHTIKFGDSEQGRPSTGRYRAVYTPAELGRHRALVTVVGSPRAAIADPLGRLLHSEAGEIEVKAAAPHFRRQVVVYFEIENREKARLEEDERPSESGIGRRRPTELRSAENIHLYPGDTDSEAVAE